MLRKNVASQNVFFAMVNASTGAADASATVTARVAIDAGAQAAGSGTVTNLGNGQYRYAPTQAETNGNQIGYFFTATGDIPVSLTVLTTAADPTDATAFGISRLDAAVSSRMATFTLPTNFASLAITGGGAVTAGTVSDKTGYTLTQAFPANFSSLAITGGGAVTVGTNNDKTGYTVTGTVSANVAQINGDATAAANLAKTTRAIVRGTVTTGATTTSIPTSAVTPAGAAADQFKGKIITFDADTATAALRGQSTDIAASTNSATPTFTVTALTTTPASGDTFSIT